MPARGADAHDLVELLVEQHLLAGRALRPEVGRVSVAARAERRQLDRHQSSPDRALTRTRPVRAARTARAIGDALAPGRVRRHATYAAPAIDRAAEVSAPPRISGWMPSSPRSGASPSSGRGRTTSAVTLPSPPTAGARRIDAAASPRRSAR